MNTVVYDSSNHVSFCEKLKAFSDGDSIRLLGDKPVIIYRVKGTSSESSRDVSTRALKVLIRCLKENISGESPPELEVLALAHLFEYYKNFPHAEKKLNKGIKLIQECFYEKVKKNGTAEVQYQLGKDYWRKKTIEGDKKAIELFKLAVGQQHLKALHRLVFCYIKERSLDRQNQGEVFHILSRVVQNGSAAKIQYLLGRCYNVGLGIHQDLNLAFFWYRQAADQHYGPALFSLAKCYQKGFGTQVDNIKASKCFNEAADQGNRKAQMMLCEFYLNAKDNITREGIDLLGKYAYQGNPLASNLLGNFHASEVASSLLPYDLAKAEALKKNR